eukprot:GCRY01000656.1.p1 GENE.GCRY01000656.1~~GCRY01000656.1.p1  ORF type:complete len:1019 (-),score=344.88 GCRY01000656.1:248-3304(-)
MTSSTLTAVKRQEDMAEVKKLLTQSGWIPADQIDSEVFWFYEKLGFHDFYFLTTPLPFIAKHIGSLYGAKVLCQAQKRPFEISLDCEDDSDYVMFATVSHPGQVNKPCRTLEEKLDREYLLDNKNDKLYNLSSYRTEGHISENFPVHLRLYILTAGVYEVIDSQETELTKIADKRFMERVTPNTIKIYRGIVEEAAASIGPVIKVFDFKDSVEKRIVCAFHRNHNPKYHSLISAVFQSYGFTTSRKYLENFSNGIVASSFYLKPIKGCQPDASALDHIVDEMSSLFVLPRTSLYTLCEQNVLTPKEHNFAYSCWKFAHQFMSRYDTDYETFEKLISSVPGEQPHLLLATLKRRLRFDTFNEKNVRSALMSLETIHLVKALYSIFEQRFNPQTPDMSQEAYFAKLDTVKHQIEKEIPFDLELEVFRSLVVFCRAILKTNFFNKRKVAISFRLDPSFLSTVEYPECPYGVFMVVGAEFRGFHVRFADVARGGVRIVRSVNQQAFANNVSQVFSENYNLAYTQQKKNKDIPEGGSKGIILLHYDNQDKADVAFKKYIDAILDIIIPTEISGCPYKDYTGRSLPEILFLGPDEGTADYMNWAMDWARHRRYSHWKAITTGKTPQAGGIPHDMFGMTTRSVHQYVLGILAEMGIDEASVTKLQTGGPDGDLGSNEIKISKDKTTTIIDGSGVAHDPAGLNRPELLRLAEKRLPIENFNRKKLGPNSFLVTCADRNVVLPNGEVVENGISFRNTFHLSPLAKADIFVPCGGRPESINVHNFHQLLADGKPRFRFIVEGANLFITQAARLELEKRGCVIIKDASANKGGVTCSSKEVLAALSLADNEHRSLFCCKDSTQPKMYKTYVDQTIEHIEENAKREFKCLWREHQMSGTPFAILTDTISEKINNIAHSIEQSDLWNIQSLRDYVMVEATPKVLTSHLGLKTFYDRVPDNYLRAIFGSYLGARYVYEYGAAASEFALFEFIKHMETEALAHRPTAPTPMTASPTKHKRVEGPPAAAKKARH